MILRRISMHLATQQFDTLEYLCQTLFNSNTLQCDLKLRPQGIASGRNRFKLRKIYIQITL